MAPFIAIEQLAKRVSVDITDQLGYDENVIESFWPILIELLPILVDWLGRECAPENAQQLRQIAGHKGLQGRLARYRYRRAIRALVADQTAYREWGQQIGPALLNVVNNQENDELIDAALKFKQPPLWGVFD